MLNAFQKAAKYAGLDDDQVVRAVDDHPAMETAMRRLNEDFAGSGRTPPVQEADWDRTNVGERFDGLN